MRTDGLWIALLGLAKNVAAHYTFAHLIVNDTTTPKWKYVREVAGDPEYAAQGEYAKVIPFTDIYSPNMVCGREAVGSGARTSVATIVAGSEVGFKIATDIVNGDVKITHPGPGQVYLSKAPNDDVQHYDGSGDWFKIAEHGIFNDTTFLLPGETDLRFILPQTTPPGKYLMRVEQFQPSASFGGSQWYVNCAQVEIVGPGGGTPVGFIKFPGGYEPFDPAIWISRVQQNGKDLWYYYPPGPYVWQG